MSINKTSQTLDHQLGNRIAALEQQMRDIKNQQPIGAGNLKVAGVPSGGVTEALFPTLAAGSSVTFIITSTPDDSTLTLWNFAHTLRVDADNGTNNFPGGSALTAGQRNLATNGPWMELDDSSDVTNTRVYKFRVVNNDTAAHTLYLRVRAYLPLLGATAS